jgi:hypothetical protein
VTAKKKILIGLVIMSFIFGSMGIFNFFKKNPSQIKLSTIEPYKDSSTNSIYNLLFCDNLNLYKEKIQKPYSYPFDIIFSDSSSILDLQKIIEDKDSEPRIKILAYNKQLVSGQKPNKKELLGVIVEIGLDNGLDVLASFKDGTARYINQTGKVLVWETTNDEVANKIKNELFATSENIVKQIGVWDKPRLTNPTKGNIRITFLVSDGLYFGEGPMNVLFSDPMASPALTKATELMQFLTEKS